MSLDKILSIATKPGLYQMVTQTRAGFVAVFFVRRKENDG